MKLKEQQGVFSIELEGWEKFWAFHFNPIDIPLDSIVSADFGDKGVSWKELRVPGTFVPGVIKAGTYISMGKPKTKAFWYYRYKNKQNTLTLHLRRGNWDKIVLTHDEASYWADKLS